AKAKEFISAFKTFSIENIPREDNQKADILGKLATVPFSHLTKEILVEVLNERSTDAREVQTIVEEEGTNWMTPIINYLEEGIVLSDKNEARSLRAKISQYVIEAGVLFKKGNSKRILHQEGRERTLDSRYLEDQDHLYFSLCSGSETEKDLSKSFSSAWLTIPSLTMSISFLED
ncbi:hypothetical protein Tco_0806492, partial [Tanacetum coccineum]